MKVMRVLEYECESKAALDKQFSQNGVKRDYTVREFYNGKSFRPEIRIKELVMGRLTPLSQRIKIAWRILVGDYEDPEVVI